MIKPFKKARYFIFGMLSAFGLFALWAAAPSTETVISLATGLKIAGKATDRIGFYDATPTPKPVITPADVAHLISALAAQGLVATATPSSTATATATATPTP